MNISYIELGKEKIDEIKPLWEELNDHHGDLSTHFSEKHEKFSFSDRKKQILKKSENGTLRIDIAKDNNTNNYVGYCISSISDELVGEVDSIYLKEKYRSSGIGKQLMNRALEWMGDEGVNDKKVVVAVGNEELLSFYEKYGFYPRHIILEHK